MSGIIRNSFAAGALFMSPGGVNMGATLEVPPAAYSPVQDQFRAKRPEEDAVGGITLEELLAMTAMNELSITPVVRETQRFPTTANDRVSRFIARTVSLSGIIKQPNKYSNGTGSRPSEARAQRVRKVTPQ